LDGVGPFVALALIEPARGACWATSRDSRQAGMVDSGDIAIRQVPSGLSGRAGGRWVCQAVGGQWAGVRKIGWQY
jgi:hypothetical protein